MDSRPANEDDTMMITLYEASLQGCVSTLNRLMQKEPLILTKLSLTTISETPLHVSASLGHVAFTRALLLHKPKLASELNSHRRSPLHLASAEGHTETVQELLLAYDNACLLPDQDGRIPLHYAVMRGRADAAKELVRVSPESMKVLDSGETAFHLCVRYNKLETLKVLVEVVGERNEVLNSRDCNSRNTILHLAVMLKQTENIKYLLSLPAVRAEANTRNRLGFTALDILDYSPNDFRSLQIRCLLMEAGIKSRNNESENLPILPLPESTTPITVPDEVHRPRKKTRHRKYLNCMGDLFKINANWLEETRGHIMVVATVISTMSFQAATGPSDAILQDSPETTWKFVLSNTFSFVISLSVTLLLLSGLPLRNKFGMWILSISLCMNLHLLAYSLFIGASAVVISVSTRSDAHQGWRLSTPIYVWSGFVWLVSGFLSISFFVWVAKKLIRLFKRKRSKASFKATTAPRSSDIR